MSFVLSPQPLRRRTRQIGHAAAFDRASRQRFDEQVAVFFGHDAPVEDRHHAAVGLGADQAAEALCLSVQTAILGGGIGFRSTGIVVGLHIIGLLLPIIARHGVSILLRVCTDGGH